MTAALIRAAFGLRTTVLAEDGCNMLQFMLLLTFLRHQLGFDVEKVNDIADPYPGAHHFAKARPLRSARLSNSYRPDIVEPGVSQASCLAAKQGYVDVGQHP